MSSELESSGIAQTFVGRVNELQAMRDWKGAGILTLVVIGGPGVGKTALVRRFVNENSDLDFTQFSRFAHRNPEWERASLLVIDGWDELEPTIREYVERTVSKRVARGLRTIVVGRSTEGVVSALEGRVFATVHVGPLSSQDSASLVERLNPQNRRKFDQAQILDFAHGNPLLLTLIAQLLTTRVISSQADAARQLFAWARNGVGDDDRELFRSVLLLASTTLLDAGASPTELLDTLTRGVRATNEIEDLGWLGASIASLGYQEAAHLLTQRTEQYSGLEFFESERARAAMFASNGDFDAAIDLLATTASALEHLDHSAARVILLKCDIAVLQTRTGDPADAVEQLQELQQRALAISGPNSPLAVEVSAAHGRALAAVGQYAAAAITFERLIDYPDWTQPNRSSIVVDLAGCWLAMGDLRRAIPLLENLVAVQGEAPERLVAQLLLGRAYAAVGDSHRAIQLLESVLSELQMSGSDPYQELAATEALAGMLLQIDEVERAIRYLGFAIVVAQNLGDAEAQARSSAMLAEAHFRQGDFGGGSEILDRTSQQLSSVLNPNSDALQMLERVRSAQARKLADPSREDRPAVLIYLLVDTSASMAGPVLESLNAELLKFFNSSGDQRPSENVEFVSMLTFNDQASVHVPLSRRGSVSVVPTLVARGSTHYGGVFRLLRNQIERDVRDIKAQGHRVYRPIVFFLTDGAPSDSSWLEAFESLSPTAFRLSPRIVAFGLGDASKADIARIGDAGAFQLQPQSELHIGRVIEGALRRMSATVTSSVSASETSWARPLKVLQDLPGLENVTVETTARKLDEDHWQRSDPDKQARGQGLANQLHDAIAKLEGELAAAKASGDAKNVARAQEALDARKVWLDALDS